LYVPSPEDRVFKEWFERTRNVPGLPPVEIYLPGQRLDQPNREEKTVLLKLRERGGSSDTLTTLIKWCGMNPEDPVTKNRLSRIVTRLEKKGFVEKSETSSGKRVSLTIFGKMFAEAIGE